MNIDYSVQDAFPLLIPLAPFVPLAPLVPLASLSDSLSLTLTLLAVTGSVHPGLQLLVN